LRQLRGRGVVRSSIDLEPHRWSGRERRSARALLTDNDKVNGRAAAAKCGLTYREFGAGEPDRRRRDNRRAEVYCLGYVPDEAKLVRPREAIPHTTEVRTCSRSTCLR
jgi:hypothetical protein